MNRYFPVRALFVAIALFSGAAGASAQARPTPEQARALLQARPDLIARLRQSTAGMSRDQIRARLRAEGYPEDLLDAYISGSAGTAGTGGSLAALSELGVPGDTSDQLRDVRGMYALEALLDSIRIGHRRVMRTDIADSLARADSGFNIFGLEVFRSATARFDATVGGLVDANYRLGAGDRLVLILTGDVEEAISLDVTREGFVVIPRVGQIHVANLTLGQLEDVLYARLGRVYSGVRRGPGATTRFSVSVSRLRANQVFVLGEVERPGTHMLSSVGTAITALYAAGGPKANGSLRQIQIKRGGVVISTLDLYDYLLRGDGSRDQRLETGDIVFIPPRGPRVRIIGEVTRPGTYELKPGETLGNLIAAAGGLHEDASIQRVHIERVVPLKQRGAAGRDRVTIDVAASAAPGSAPEDTRLEGGDVVRVFPISERVSNTITVSGNVWSPGRQGLRPGMRIADAIRVAGGPKPDVYLGQVLVSRLRPDSSRVQLRARLADSTGRVIDDFPLMEDDEIELFSLSAFRPDRYVSIGGAVRSGGRFPYREGMTMRDLILLAGGLVESAYLREAEIARLPSDRTGAATSTTIRVPLDSTYLFERRPGERYLGAPGLSAAAGGSPEFLLLPYDNVLIMHQPNWEMQRVVTIEGEVRFPGPYALRDRNERVADLIVRAGGLTSEAYPDGTNFVRARDSIGRVAIDVPQALRRRNSPDNLLLENGDRITVPRRSSVVTVRGAVNAPNVVAYVEGKDLFYYIGQAGGEARNGDLRRAYITQPNGKRDTRSITNSAPRPKPGSVVVVPEIDPSSRTNWMQVLAVTAPILASLATLLVAINQQ
jgi:polysaccharide export outer membrane protein